MCRASGDAPTVRRRVTTTPVNRAAVDNARAKIISLKPKLSDRRKSNVVGVFPRRETRDRPRPFHRHCRLLQIAHQRAERADAKVAGNRAWHGAIPDRRSGGKTVAAADW